MIFPHISIIGGGNVAYHLTRRISEIYSDINITVYSRSGKNNKLFSQISGQVHISHEDIFHQPGLYIVAVKDNAITSVSSQIVHPDATVCHTSGSVNQDALSGHAYTKYGVLYPLQTFSIERDVNWSDIPFLINGNISETTNDLLEFARSLSGVAIVADDSQRKSTHIAAVFANNFTNHMMALAEEWLDMNGLEFSILRPLILETINKLNTLSPKNAQTGHAIRHDDPVINMHLKEIEKYPAHLKVYRAITASIKEMYLNQTDKIWEINS